MDSSDALLNEVRAKTEALNKAKQDYLIAVMTASSRGYSNVQIARAARKTEAAIRMYINRKIRH